MAHHKSAKKRIRQTAKRTARNRSLRSTLRTSIKKFRGLLTESDAAQVQEGLPTTHKAIDKMVTKGVLHPKTAARYKSRLALAANKALASGATA
ncbi:MAG: 30S ribosomal protein S20 [bacterium]|jgi:small subunit ribosomal protein S20